MKKQGTIVVISGFSGVGKGTVVKLLRERYDAYALSVSATTRAKRKGEIEGESYFFKTQEEFDRMVSEDAFLEYARYVNGSYGTPKKYVEEQNAAGKDIILEIEVQGALQIKKKYPEALLLFLVPPSADVLRQRLIGRGTDSMEVIEQRLVKAVEEAKDMEHYDYIVVNDDLDECVENVHHVIQSAGWKMSRRQSDVEALRKEISTFLH